VDALHALTLGDVLREHRRSRPHQGATVDGPRRQTFPELDQRVNRLAQSLRNAGVGPGERVLWLGQNSARVLELLLAVAKLGAMFCPANWRQSAGELAFVIDDLEPRIVVWQEAEVGAATRQARDATRSDARWIRHDTDGHGDDQHDGDEGYEQFLARGEPDDPDVAVDPGVAVLLVYTAAFGGRPNAAMLSHTACVAQGLVYGHVTGTSADDVYLNSGPLFHLGTLMHTLATFVAGGTNVFVRRVDAEELCRVVEAERCTGAFLVGPIFDDILAANAAGAYDLSSLRTPRGNPEWNAMTSRDPSAWAARPGGYGQTEAVGMMTFACFGADAAGPHGRPSPVVQMRVVDPDGRDVPDGEPGELVARGPTVMNGYWNRPEENARRHRDGWHHTNDLGRREADGSITFIGPKTRMIKSAAENIYPAEVEGCIATHDSVRECAVIGVPDPPWVQSVKAIVVLHDGAAVGADEIVEHCRTRIASYKKPRFVEFVDALPREGFAVDYEALDERFGGGNYPGGTTRSA
jgi:acyl-CoA synthetase (AMP-forming)/AMP-acid ligase II